MDFDNIGTGPITQKQLLTIKRLSVYPSGSTYGRTFQYVVKSFDLIYMPHLGGPSTVVNCIGASLPVSTLEVFKRAKQKDYIIVGNLKLFGLEKFKQNTNAKPLWTVVADK